MLQIVVHIGRRKTRRRLKVLLVGRGDRAAQVRRVREAVVLAHAPRVAEAAARVGHGFLAEDDLADALGLRVVAEGGARGDRAHRAQLRVLGNSPLRHIILNVRVVKGERGLVDAGDLVAVGILDDRAARLGLVLGCRADAACGTHVDTLGHVAQAPLLRGRDVRHLEVGELVRGEARVALVQRVVELNVALAVVLVRDLAHEDDLAGCGLVHASVLGLARRLDLLLARRLVRVGHHVADLLSRALVILGLAVVEIGRGDTSRAHELGRVLRDQAGHNGRVLAADQVEALLSDEVLVHALRLALLLALLVEERAALARELAVHGAHVDNGARVGDGHLVLAAHLVVVDDLVGRRVHRLVRDDRVGQTLGRVGRDVVWVAQVEARAVAGSAFEVALVLARLVEVAAAEDEFIRLGRVDHRGARANGRLALRDVEGRHLALGEVLGRVARVVGEVARVVDLVAVDVGAHDAVEAVHLRVGELGRRARGHVVRVEANVRARARSRIEHGLVRVVRLGVVEVVAEDELVGLGGARLQLHLARKQLTREALVRLDRRLARGALVVGLLDVVGVLQRLLAAVDDLLSARAHRVDLAEAGGRELGVRDVLEGHLVHLLREEARECL